MSLSDAATFVADDEVMAPLTVAIVDHALTVLGEDSSTPGHPQRASLAIQAMYDPQAWAKRIVWSVATNEDVVDAWVSGDKDTALSALPGAIEQIWSSAAGVTTY